MENLVLKGTLIEKSEEQTFGEKFKKRSFVIETEDKYPQLIQLELHQDNCELITPVNVGDIVECLFNVRGRKWISEAGEVRYFNSLVVWKLSTDHKTLKEKVVTGLELEDDNDGLPF